MQSGSIERVVERAMREGRVVEDAKLLAGHSERMLLKEKALHQDDFTCSAIA